MPTSISFRRWLLEQLQDQQLSIRDVATIAGVNATYIGELLLGAPLDEDGAHALSKALYTTPQFLLVKAGQPDPPEPDAEAMVLARLIQGLTASNRREVELLIRHMLQSQG